MNADVEFLNAFESRLFRLGMDEVLQGGAQGGKRGGQAGDEGFSNSA